MAAAAHTSTEDNTAISHNIGLGTVFAMAVACAFAVANTYYNQPMMVNMARDLGVQEGLAGFITTITQAGYTMGLLLLSPLGDRYERRKLIMSVIGLLIIALMAASVAPSFSIVLAASFFIGMFSVSAQYIIPMAAHLAPPEKRGRVIGIVMAGLLSGILGARTLAGFIAEYANWRIMFVIAAIIMVAVAALVRLTFPKVASTSTLSYGALMRSLLPLWRAEPVLRESTIVAAFAFATFNIFWTTLTPHLASPELGYGPSVAGLFGIIGLIGAFAATIAGRLADHVSSRLLIGVSCTLMLSAFMIMGVAGQFIIGLVVGVIILDIALQGVQITSQTRIFGLQPDARNRVNTIFMTAYFIGGTAGSFIGTLAWQYSGWAGVSIAGIIISLSGLTLHILGPRLFACKPRVNS